MAGESEVLMAVKNQVTALELRVMKEREVQYLMQMVMLYGIRIHKL